ncbi:AIR synthase related protein [Calorimonas adulescens]|uniref:PurM-like N-terminal domain-containing protein n=1 Tax=Calorimonas adulescens TaxID=2606906 RepID=A0A5D8QC14_9THEO|nr:AIR synthase related protein [Calorimonas adulescens]TZE81346.1 hypothetical protein FWJ32_09955 [Calorimonas adulescens]
MIERYRDLVIIYEADAAYVISCDSLGAIGNKEHDALKVDEEIVGRTTVKVALSEALCVGAEPLVISDTLSVEMNPAGEKILRGIKSELEENGLLDVVFTGSTEENFPTSMTGIGITVIAKANIGDLKVKKVKAGMHVSLLGYPRVGNEVLSSKDVLTLKDYVKISNSKEIIEAIPVGSKGIKYEIGVLENISGAKVEANFPQHLDVLKSGGPSTCCLVIHGEEDTASVKRLTNKPFTYIGKLI